MVAYRKMRIYQILLLVLALTLSNCMTDEYNLSKGLNTDMTLGGDSLSFPLGKTDTITLKSLIKGNDSTKLDTTMFKESADGSYSINFKGSIVKSIDTIPRKSIQIDPILITPINSSFAEIKFPSFTINPIVLQSDLPIPDFNISGKTISGINSDFEMGAKIQPPSPVKQLSKASLSNPYQSKSVTTVIRTIDIIDSSKINQSLNFSYPVQLKKINNIALMNSKVTLTFDKTIIPQAFTVQSDMIKKFEIIFPAEFKLTSNLGLGTSIVGSSFIITNAALTSGVPYTASFVISSLDMSAVTQNGALAYNKDIPYKLNYSCTGDVNLLQLQPTDELKVKISLRASSEIDDMGIETNPFAVAVDPGNSPISQTITNIPSDISEVKSLTFVDGAELQLNIDNPGISPFQFTGGNCKITLPQLIEFKPFAGLNSTTNELTLPINDLFGSKNIGISGIKLNKTIVNQQISISDALTYSVNNLEVGSVVPNTKFNDLLLIKNKKLNVTGNIVGLNVKDATITTKSISLDIPNQPTNIDINQLVSTLVKKIYSITLKTPAQLKFKIEIKNLPTNIDSIFLDNYTIKLPGSLKFKTGDVNSQNEVVLNRGFKVSEGLTKTLTLEKFDFSDEVGGCITLTDGIFLLTKVVSMSGKAYIKGANLNSSDIGTVQIKPTIEIGKMDIALIEGKIAPVINPITQNIPLSLPEMFKNKNNNLDIINPVITLEIGNTMGIPIDVVLNLIPKSKGSIIPNGTVTSPTLHIAAAAVLGQPTPSNFRISKSFEVYPDGYISIPIANLPNLLKTIPDSIEINATPTVSGERHNVDLYSPKNELDLKYSVNVPFDFGQNFKIQFNDTIPDLKSSLKDIIKMTRNIDVVAVVKSTIPMNLAFSIEPLDSINQRIDGITVNADSILYDNTKPINFGLKETVAGSGSLDKLDKFIITISASKNPITAALPLKSDQYLILELRVKIPNGITIKQNPTKK